MCAIGWTQTNARYLELIALGEVERAEKLKQWARERWENLPDAERLAESMESPTVNSLEDVAQRRISLALDQQYADSVTQYEMNRCRV